MPEGFDTFEQKLKFMQTATGLSLEPPVSHFDKEEFAKLASRIETTLRKNSSGLCLIGEGIYPFNLDPVTEKAILSNPRWYSPYTPYQPEISQGRLTMLWYFQEFFRFYSGHEIGVASMLDLGSATCDAVLTLRNYSRSSSNKVLLLSPLFDTVLSTLRNRLPGIEITDNPEQVQECFCAIINLPDKFGETSLDEWMKKISTSLPLILVVDPFYLTAYANQIRSLQPSITVGSAQRIGCPMWCGGPYPAFLTAKHELLRHLPGRIVGRAKDSLGVEGYRLAVQTREQHIRKDKATSNICTSQSLTAVLVVAQLMLLGREGLQKRVNKVVSLVKKLARSWGSRVVNRSFFDSLCLKLTETEILELRNMGIYGYKLGDNTVRFSFSDQIDYSEDRFLALTKLIGANDDSESAKLSPTESEPVSDEVKIEWPGSVPELTDELEFNRFIAQLERRDYSHLDGMIPLGSCTMKLNSARTLIYIAHPANANLHPLQPKETLEGFCALLEELEQKIAALTGFPKISFHPNSGAQGELCALIAIRKYFRAIGASRSRVLIPTSAHGTNFASAKIAGFEVEYLKTNENGGVDISDLQQKISSDVACVMLTYPSTFGVFDEEIVTVNQVVKDAGAFSYLDGANFNAFMGWMRPAELGFDVCHLNLHKTFGIPHGGGGPGACAVGFCETLKSVAPKTIFETSDLDEVLYTNSSPFGNSGALIISLMYINLLGCEGIRDASFRAVWNANYLKNILAKNFDVLAVNKNGFVAHEFLLRFRELSSGRVSVFDIAKRLIDYGFHPPTMNWPVQNCLMIEPTESEPQAELNRFAEALENIRQEIVNWSESDKSPLKNAPHAWYELIREWRYEYTREVAFPNLKNSRFVAPIKRLNEADSDREMLCGCSS